MGRDSFIHTEQHENDLSMCKLITLNINQGNLKGEFVVAAILPSPMEVSSCTPGFFVANPIKQF